MAKIIVWDSNTTRANEYTTQFASIADETLKVTTSINDLQDCKLFFRHSNDGIDDIEDDVNYKNAIKIEFSGGGQRSEITKDTFPFEAMIESWSDIFRVLDILDKDTYTIDDVYHILGFDPKLEELLEPFATANPFKGNPELKKAKEALQEYLTSKLG